MKEVIYKTTTRVCCEDTCAETQDVIVCVSPTLTANGQSFIYGTITEERAHCCSCMQTYDYYISYDETQLAAPSYSLINSDILSVICANVVSWVKDVTCWSCADSDTCVYPEVYPECFGDVTSDATEATLDAIASLGTRGGIVRFSAKTYTFSAPLIVPSHISLIGAGMNATQLYFTGGASADFITYQDSQLPDSSTRYSHIRDLYIKGTSAARHGVYSQIPYGLYISRTRIEEFGGVGILSQKQVGGTGQSTYIDKSVVRLNKSGGIRLGLDSEGGDMGHIVDSIINENGYFGVYLSRQVIFQIRDCEFAGYNYGRINAGLQAYPICIHGGTSLIIEGNSFENNGGQVGGTAVGCNIRFGFAGDTQTEPNDANTVAVIVRGNDFKAVGGTSGDIDHIKLHWVKGVSLDDNTYEKSGTYTGTVNGIRFGTLGGGKLVIKNPYWNGTLDNKYIGAYNDNALIIDDVTGTERLQTEMQIADPAYPAFVVTRTPKASYPYPMAILRGAELAMGNGTVAPVKVVGQQSTGWVTLSGTAVKSNAAINADTITATNAEIQALAKAVKALYDLVLSHGLAGA